MENKNVKKISLLTGAVVGGTLLTGQLSVAADMFAHDDLGTAAQLRTQILDTQAQSLGLEKSIELKCGEGKCGEGKCGEDKKADAKSDSDAKTSEHKCGEGKCGEGKCGGDKKADAKSDAKTSEHKCGEGKCGEDKTEE